MSCLALNKTVTLTGMKASNENAALERARELLDILDLEAVERNLFLGRNEQHGRHALFGGQVLSQSLNAACRTLEADSGKKPHSLHGYFMRSGDVQRPVLYEVERIRDGRSFATRRVVAIQNGEAIFNLDVSFHVDETGMEHSEAIPNVPRPKQLEDDMARVQALVEAGVEDRRLSPMAGRPRPFEMRSVFPLGSEVWGQPRYWNPVWVRFRLPVDPADQMLARSLLAYASDMGLVGASILPHFDQVAQRDLQLISLDHAMWLHTDVDINEWLLFHRTTTWADSARALCHGSFFSRAGDLVASVSQEGLVRLPQSE